MSSRPFFNGACQPGMFEQAEDGLVAVNVIREARPAALWGDNEIWHNRAIEPPAGFQAVFDLLMSGS
jgi:hypothetical protein